MTQVRSTDENGGRLADNQDSAIEAKDFLIYARRKRRVNPLNPVRSARRTWSNDSAG